MANEVRGKIVAKASNGKGFKVEGVEGWLNASDAAVPYLAKIEKGEEVVVTYEKKGPAKNAVKIVKAGAASKAETETSEFTCKVCGKALKDGKFETCYMCGKKGGAAKSEGTGEEEKDKGAYYEKKAESIKKGNALNAAAAVLAGTEFIKTAPDPETVAELTKVVAQIFFEYLQEE